MFGRKKKVVRNWNRDVTCSTRSQATKEAREARKDGYDTKIGYVVYTRKKKQKEVALMSKSKKFFPQFNKKTYPDLTKHKSSNKGMFGHKIK